MKKSTVCAMVAAAGLALLPGRGWADYIDHHFDAAPFTNGATFLAPGISNWVASTATVVVVSSTSCSAPQSVYLPEGSAISNAVGQTPGVAWTDLRVAPMLGDAPLPGLLSGATFACYCSSNGYLTVWNGSAWLTCSNDVWNTPVPKLTNAAFATVSVYQNYTAQRAAVLVNDRVVAQDLPFLASTNRYGQFEVDNVDSDAWLDDVWIQATYDTNRLSANLNGVDGADAAELQTYGYVARTLSVGTGPYAYGSLSNALAVARDRDTLSVDCSVLYAENVVITQNLTLTGCAFTNNGTITVLAGKTVMVQTAFSSSLMVSGTVALAQGVVVTGDVVRVAGNGLVMVPTNNAQLLAGSLTITGSGQVVVTGGQVADALAGVAMAGTFILTSTWGTEAVASLDFLDDFERYAPGTRLQALGFAGWGASVPGAAVMASQGYGSSKGMLIPEGSLVSNRLATVGQDKIWTDLRLRPCPGDKPDGLDTNTTFFTGYVETNGLLNVWSGTTLSWLVCSNYVNGSNVTAMTTGGYTRVTVFANFTTHKSAVFVDGKLARELVGFPAGAGIPSYSSFQALGAADNAYVDNLRIATTPPSDLTDDLDGDGAADATEIHRRDSLLLYPAGSVFKFR